MAATSDEGMESLLSNFDQIYEVTFSSFPAVSRKPNKDFLIALSNSGFQTRHFGNSIAEIEL